MERDSRTLLSQEGACQALGPDYKPKEGWGPTDAAAHAASPGAEPQKNVSYIGDSNLVNYLVEVLAIPWSV